ncbi:MAG TPA: TolC family protein, partial [Nitrococcus sp.]|nr:TolC family protein [Nitrococcus sp.]
VSGALLALQQTRGQLAAFRGQLASVIGYSADTFIPLQPLGKKINLRPPAQSIAQLLAAARSSRPELLAAKAQEQVAAAELRTAIGQGRPSLTLNAGAGRIGILGQPTVSQYSAQLNIQIPLFAGFANVAAERQARAEIAVSQASTAELLRQVELEVWQAYQSVQTAAATIKSSAAQLRSATQAVRVTQARYRSGLDTILSVLSAQATLATARVQHIQAQLNWFAALAALGHAVGGLGPEEGGTIGGGP